MVFRLGSIARDARGVPQVELYGDLKRHDMGADLAEQIDEKGTGASVFLTENLWGVGSTAPYLHDGRATTLAGAILVHGGDAAARAGASRRSRDAAEGRDRVPRQPGAVQDVRGQVVVPPPPASRSVSS